MPDVRLITILSAMMLPIPVAACGQFGGDDLSQGFADSRGRVSVSAKAAFDRVARGADLPVAVVLDVSPGWHVWANDRELPEGIADFEFAIHTEVAVEAFDEAALTPNDAFIVWPEVHPITADYGEGAASYGFFVDRAVVYLPVMVPGDAPLGETTLRLRVTYQSCDDRTCLPPANETFEIPIEIVEGAPAPVSNLSGDFAAFPVSLLDQIRGGEAVPTTPPSGSAIDINSLGGFLLILLLAAIGGFVLNLTPCVLPVIPLKIMGLAQSAGHNRARTLALGVAMALGVVGFWLGLGVAVATVSGLTTNTLFQIPAFGITIGVIIALMAVAMCGVFTFQLPQWAYAINPRHDTLHGSFGFGVMAAVLSTPCTAPFMGGAIFGSVGQSPAIVLSVFAAIGGGMALPYVILSAKPKLIERMPRSGPAGELIKQVLALLMLGVAAYFAGIGFSGMFQEEGQPASRAYWWAAGLFVVLSGLWLAYRTIRITPSAGRRAIFAGFGLLLVVAGSWLSARMTAKGPVEWVYYTPERLDHELEDGNVVVLKFTAEWCANCHFLERTVIYSDDVVAALDAEGVTPMKVDITSGDAKGNDLLVNYSLSIPYLVIMKPDGEVTFQADWYTASQVVDGIDRALGRGGP